MFIGGKMPNRKFIRTLWGIHDHQGRRLYKRRTKIDKDIELMKMAKYNKPFVTYVFGDDNYKFLVDNGFECVLVDKKPIVWDIDTQAFRHKLEALKCGIQQYNEIVLLDWDTFPIKPLPANFWGALRRKAPIQAILRIYARRKAYWRAKEGRQIPCASFVYLRSKEIAEGLIQTWEKMNRPLSEEIVMAKYMDEMMGGWEGVAKYEKLFEPDFFYLPESKVLTSIDKQYYNKKNFCFRHFNQNQVAYYLTKIKKGQKPSWVR